MSDLFPTDSTQRIVPIQPGAGQEPLLLSLYWDEHNQCFLRGDEEFIITVRDPDRPL